MTQLDPQMRPSVDEALEQFQKIVSKMSRFQLCLHLRLTENPGTEYLMPLHGSWQRPVSRYSLAIADMGAIARECRIIVKTRVKRMIFPSKVAK